MITVVPIVTVNGYSYCNRKRTFISDFNKNAFLLYYYYYYYHYYYYYYYLIFFQHFSKISYLSISDKSIEEDTCSCCIYLLPIIYIKLVIQRKNTLIDGTCDDETL